VLLVLPILLLAIRSAVLSWRASRALAEDKDAAAGRDSNNAANQSISSGQTSDKSYKSNSSTVGSSRKKRNRFITVDGQDWRFSAFSLGRFTDFMKRSSISNEVDLELRDVSTLHSTSLAASSSKQSHSDAYYDDERDSNQLSFASHSDSTISISNPILSDP
jgi:hypothetical protein